MFKTNEHGKKMNTRPKYRKNQDYEILEEAILAFRQETNIKMEKSAIFGVTEEGEADAEIKLEVGERTLKYGAEIKRTLTEAVVGQLAHFFQNKLGNWLVVTRFVPAPLAKKMHQLGVEFIDTAGNAYIDDPRIHVFICGNKPVQAPWAWTDEGVLGRAGFHVVFGLLCNRELEKATYRQIAKAAIVALGTVANVINDLTKQGFLIETKDGGRRLIKKKELFEKWTTAYAEKLRPKKLIGRYAANRPNFWQDIDLAAFDALWGGEVAANKLVQYLKPEVVTIYTPKPVNNLVLQLKLRQDDLGPVELRERFWRFENPGPDRHLAPPLLVYADLVATADARNVETAKMIYDQYLERHLGEN